VYNLTKKKRYIKEERQRKRRKELEEEAKPINGPCSGDGAMAVMVLATTNECIFITPPPTPQT